MFSRPHLCKTDRNVDIAVSLDSIRSLDSYASFLNAVQQEVVDVYGPEEQSRLNREDVCYSTQLESGAPFSNAFSERIFDLLKVYDSAHSEAVVRRKEYEDMMAARPPPVKPEPKFDENGEEIPPPPKSKKAQREEAEQRKKDTEQLRNVLIVEHKAECAAIKLKNAFDLKAIRVGLNSK